MHCAPARHTSISYKARRSAVHVDLSAAASRPPGPCVALPSPPPSRPVLPPNTMMSKLKLLACCGHLALLLLGSVTAAPHQHMMAPALAPGPPPPCTDWPQTCPDGKSGIPRSPYKQTWMMNLSTIIMPCNNTGYTDPESTKGWGIVD
eukprot:COSAG02_NODE_1506_length_12232_cov_420.616088_1_plen_147_part_10